MATESRLQHFPNAFFAMIMGFSGLTLAFEKAQTVLPIGMPVNAPLAVFALALFALLLLVYLLKWIRFPAAVKKEMQHPVRMNFFPAISISLILLGTCFLHLSPQLAKALWMTGAGLHLMMTLIIMGVWMHHEHFEINHINPSWFIPVVGNIIVPIAGVQFGYTELSWFFFSIGLVFWLVLMTIFFYRVFFHNPMPVKLMPTFFILIAPPAVGCLSYTRLAGEVDGASRILFYTGLYLTLLLATQVRRFASLPFFLSWWAYSFPLAAMTVATLMMAQTLQSAFLTGLGAVLLVVLCVVITGLLLLTLRALVAGKICVPED
ncbi:SLAC1 anion channel family protein [Granulosicoccaceae sp. 1_MG-2023]|nr:SLAC1 anion channel family protein [Granulosicoccaceae sp. 1_MG-2023]